MPVRVRNGLAGLRRDIGDGPRVLLFGSRAVGDGRRASDWDIAILADAPLEWDRFAVAKQACQEASWPYRVDVVDLARAPMAFRQQVLSYATELEI
jgi:predicted nucleotidyltransferase